MKIVQIQTRKKSLSGHFSRSVHGAKWKKLIIDWNEYKDNTASFGFQFHSLKASWESCFTLSFNYAGLCKERSVKQAADIFQRIVLTNLTCSDKFLFTNLHCKAYLRIALRKYLFMVDQFSFIILNLVKKVFWTLMLLQPLTYVWKKALMDLFVEFF